MNEPIFETPYTTAERLKTIMEDRNLRQVDILRLAKPFCEKFDVKLGRNALSQYLSGKVRPGQKKLTILGLALGVSEAWLMGFDVPPERITTPVDSEADGREREVISIFRGLSAEKQALVVQMLRGISNG